jgi:PAS domain S-box-containing protein
MATILIVDDVAADREALIALLRDHGHRMLEAVDGRKGLAAVQAECPDLVIAGVRMPVMDGYEFVRQLARDPATSRIPVLFYTAHAGERDARAGGAYGVLKKPAEAEEVLQMVGRALAGRPERYDAEAQLRLQAAALNAAANAMVITDRAGIIEWVNPAFCELTGYTAAEAMGRNPRDLLKSDQHDQQFYKTLWDTVLSGRVWRGEIVNRRKDGSLYTEDQTITPVRDPQGEIRHFIAVKQDVTDRHTLEAQFLQAQKMEAVGQLAGGVAHDFNNLLTAILGYCELLLADIGQSDPRRADIAEIQKAGTRAAGLTRQLLAFSRKQIIEPTLLDLNVVIGDIRGMLERLIGEDIRVTVRLRPQLAPVKADRGQVEQIVMNLAVNARDAMPKGGTLTIETATVELDEHYAARHSGVTPGGYVMLTVSDTGTGITPQVQARLFEPFFTTKEPGTGTGLGLATVYGIVKRTGGSINVYSEVGRGTSFRVYIPRAGAAEMVEDAPASVPLPRAGTQTVLVVEDEDGLRELAKRLLERQGYTVLAASDADQAIQLFDQNPSIDVLLTDVVMPGTSGPELTRALAERRPGLKVVYMSGYTENAIVHHGVLKPGVAFIHKPFTSDTLARKIREVLDR